jgi:hypothetical protein
MFSSYLELWTMDKVHKPSGSECFIPTIVRILEILLVEMKFSREVTLYFSIILCLTGARGGVLVKALCYKPEGCGFNTRLGEFLNLPIPSGHSRPWGLLSL